MSAKMKILDADYFIIGSGIAGLVSAIRLAESGRVLLVTKKNRADSNTNLAQGGIACVVASEDSFEEHVNDTLVAGAGLCNEAVVRAVVADGPRRIKELEELGIVFTEQLNGASGYDLGREGGHSKRRVLHVGDMTGREIEKVLLKRAMANPNVTILEHHMLIDLICAGRLGIPGGNRCIGAYLLERLSGQILAVRSPATILATGGGGKVYLYTTNPDIATGDGYAAAWRAGVPVRNMEFIQFHPTCFYHPEARSFLVSEAVRGEGAVLVDGEGHSFMENYDERGSLAPRDIVARAIDNEMKKSGALCVYLDIRSKPKEFLVNRFPNIYETCLSYGIDMAEDLIPVVPAAHYFCGGIEAGLDGRTPLPGLYACGEASCTGLHGANRLASNSLLEALVCANRMAEHLASAPSDKTAFSAHVHDWEYGNAVHSDEEIVVEHNWNEVRTCMWDYVGIVRTDKRLDRALRRIGNLREEIRDYYWDYLVTPDILELRNIADVAEIIIRSALMRKESRGIHYTLDYPAQDNSSPSCDTVICGNRI